MSERRSNNRVRSSMSRSFRRPLVDEDIAGYIKRGDDAERQYAVDAMTDRSSARKEEVDIMKLESLRRTNTAEDIARREELRITEEENKLTASRQLKEVNDDFQGISDSIRGIDVNDDDSYSSGIQNLPAGVDLHPVLASQRKDLERRRQNSLTARKKAAVDSERLRVNGINDFKNGDYKLLSADQQSVVKKRLTDNPNLSAEDLKSPFVEDIDIQRKSNEMAKAADSAMKLAQESYDVQNSTLDSQSETNKGLRSELKDLNTRSAKLKKDGGSLDSTDEERRVALSNQRDSWALDDKNAEKARDESNLALEAATHKSLTASYNSTHRDGIGRHNANYSKALYDIQGDNEMSPTDKKIKSNEVIQRSAKLYDASYPAMRNSHAHIFSERHGKIPSDRRPSFASEASPRARGIFLSQPSRGAVMLNGELVVDPFNPPAPDKIAGVSLREEYIYKSQVDPDIRDKMNGVFRRLGVVKDEDQEKMDKLFTAAFSGDPLDEEVMATLTPQERSFIDDVLDNKYHMRNGSFDQLLDLSIENR